jgi:hypothetical protein
MDEKFQFAFVLKKTPQICSICFQEFFLGANPSDSISNDFTNWVEPTF